MLEMTFMSLLHLESLRKVSKGVHSSENVWLAGHTCSTGLNSIEQGSHCVCRTEHLLQICVTMAKKSKTWTMITGNFLWKAREAFDCTNFQPVTVLLTGGKRASKNIEVTMQVCSDDGTTLQVGAVLWMYHSTLYLYLFLASLLTLCVCLECDQPWCRRRAG